MSVSADGSIIERYGIAVLELNPKAEKRADAYIEQGIIPATYRTDGIHIAIAAVNDLDMIVSMNLSPYRKTKNEKQSMVQQASMF